MNGWKFPNDVPGWLSEAEGRKLAELARGKRVLEIGCFQGRSTICMAQTAASVDTIDPCDGRATDAPGEQRDMIDALAGNLMRYGTTGNVRVFVGTTAEAAPDLDPGYDLVFIDGDHGAEAVAIDVSHARRLLSDNGLIAFHDYREGEHEGRFDPDVTAAVDRLILDGAQLEARAGTVIALKLKPAECEKPLVFLSIPRAGRWSTFGACRGFQLWATFGRFRVALGDAMGSILDQNFNRCLAGALNARKRGATHWALIHEDICPDAGWLDILETQRLQAKADIISAVVPIKDERDICSTAIESGDTWNPRRLTMTQAYELPETFGDADVGGRLLLNTGLWLCDLRAPWVEALDSEGVDALPCFQTLSKLGRKPDGEYHSLTRSEDWEWSRELRRRGAVQVATRAVGLDHIGEWEFSNRSDRKIFAGHQWRTDRVHEKTEAGECTPTTTASVS